MGAPSQASDALLAELKTLHPKLIDLSLGRIERLLGKLGSPHLHLPEVIHIAGTNGKGSSTAFLKAILQAAGRRVHAYTSPHLVRFHERIELAAGPGRSEPISESALVDVLERVRHINAGDPITQFEITTAAAFLAFADTPADAVILEVGLGGRLDATNVVPRPAATLITPVSIDHADKLGDTLARIAGEKAGILKRGIPAVISEQPEEALDVIRQAGRRVGAPLTIFGEDFQAFEQGGRLVFQSDTRLLDLPLPSLVGRHQITNAGATVAVALGLERLGVDERAIERGLTTAVWPARMQRMSGGYLSDLLREGSELWLDGGHNPAGGQALAEALATLEEKSQKPLIMIVGMMGQKDAEGFLKPFSGLAKRLFAVPVPDAHEPSHSAQALAEAARSTGLAASTAPDVMHALSEIWSSMASPVRVIICGSLYLAGHVLAAEQGLPPPRS